MRGRKKIVWHSEQKKKKKKKTLEKMFEICLKLTKNTPDNFTDIFLVSLLLTLNILHTFFYCSYR